MSVYQKFIDSAASASSASSASLTSRQLPEPSGANSLSLKFESKARRASATSPAKGSLAMLRQQTMSNLHLPSLINTTISSTPLMSKQQQYKRLVEADYYSSSQPQQQQQYQLCHRQHQYLNSPIKLQQVHLKPANQQQQQQQQQHRTQITIRANHRAMSRTGSLESLLDTKDPVLREWLRAMRFETELECLSSLQARTLAIDEPAAGALSVRNSQVAIQEMSQEASFIMDYLNHLIEALPLMFNTVPRFASEFSELWTRLAAQTAAKVNTNQMQIQTNQHLTSRQHQQQQRMAGSHLTIINCTPRKSAAASARVTRPLDGLAHRIRTICVECANLLCDYEENNCTDIDNTYLEASLRRLKELYGQFVEISMRIECANIVRALDYDFSQSSLNRLSSSSSLQAVRPFESTSAQLPLKWALIALWQLTKNDSHLCRVLTEKWQTHASECPAAPSNKLAKRLDYSTKYDGSSAATSSSSSSSGGSNSIDQDNNHYASSLRSDYHKLYSHTMQAHCKPQGRQQLTSRRGYSQGNQENHHQHQTGSGALSSALKSKQQAPVKQVSTIELLIDIIISQPNKHERLDMMNLIHTQAQHDKLIDVDEWDQSVSAAIYTSNQYKVAALRILNHLCVNDQAIKTTLKCFSTPPPSQGQPIPENKIIRSIFECYQSSQEHIYQNETMFRANTFNPQQRDRKRTKLQRQQQLTNLEDSSDYGSRQTANSVAADDSIDESDDSVVKEAISLLVQLTTPFHRSQQGLDYYTLIGRYSIDSLVKYLTNIIKTTSSREMIFLSMTALANISFITTEPMKHYETNCVVLDIFRASRSRSRDLELRDQAVTILANTADKNLLDVVSSGGLNFLLSCLESCPDRMASFESRKGRQEDRLSSVVHIDNRPGDRRPIGQFIDKLPDALGCSCDQAESSLTGTMAGRVAIVSDCIARLSTSDLSAMERIHQKTAVAFARMSVDPGVTRMILKHGGVKQLIDLCKFGQKRNHSDTVLIACIAALRKMSKVLDSETFKHYHALDLIQLDLNRTLEIYGNSRSIIESQQRMFASDV